MSTSVTFLGAAGFEIVSPSYRILIDPFLTGNPLAPCAPDELEAPDALLVTHAAYDHYGDAPAIAKRTGAPVLCGADVRMKLIEDGVDPDQVTPTVWGLVTEVGGVVVRPLECHHWSMATMRDGTVVTGVPLAFIVEPEPGVRIYHYGDTSIFDMTLFGELYAPTVALLGCTQPVELLDDGAGNGTILTGEMDPDEAARAAAMLGVADAVACHYLSRTPDVDEFIRRVPAYDTTGRRRAHGPEVGETLTFEPSAVAAPTRRPA